MCPNTPGVEIIRAPTESSIKEPVRSRRGDCSYSAVRKTKPFLHATTQQKSSLVCGRSFIRILLQTRTTRLAEVAAGIRIRCNNKNVNVPQQRCMIEQYKVDRSTDGNTPRVLAHGHRPTRKRAYMTPTFLSCEARRVILFRLKRKKLCWYIRAWSIQYVARRKCRQGEETYSRRTCVHLRQWQWYPAQSYKSFGGRFGIFASAEACKW